MEGDQFFPTLEIKQHTIFFCILIKIVLNEETKFWIIYMPDIFLPQFGKL